LLGEGALPVVRRFRSFVALPLAAAFVAYLAFPVNAAQSTLPGIDVSHHNGAPHWSQVQQDGIKFVIAKATEGTAFQDPTYLTNKQQVEGLGMAVHCLPLRQPQHDGWRRRC